MTLFDAMRVKCQMCGSIIASAENFSKVSIEVTTNGIMPQKEYFFLCECCKNYFMPPFHFERSRGQE